MNISRINKSKTIKHKYYVTLTVISMLSLTTIISFTASNNLYIEEEAVQIIEQEKEEIQSAPSLSPSEIIATKVNKTPEANTTPNTSPERSYGEKYLIKTPNIYQLPDYTTGCESVSAVMALNYIGIDISVDTFIDSYLDRTLGLHFAPFDPYMNFGGDPRGNGYGCYAPVIERALNKILNETEYYAITLNNIPIDELCKQYIKEDIPVIFWATLNMQEAHIGKIWRYEDRIIEWISPEHCMLLVGYDDNSYIFNDPMSQQDNTYYDKDLTKKAYNSMLSQAVVILRKNSTEK